MPEIQSAVQAEGQFLFRQVSSTEYHFLCEEIPIVVVAGDSLNSKTSLHPEGVGAHFVLQGTLVGSGRHQADDAPCFCDTGRGTGTPTV